jgi:hypothetical protein
MLLNCRDWAMTQYLKGLIFIAALDSHDYSKIGRAFE